jgi:hypothetical protein
VRVSCLSHRRLATWIGSGIRWAQVIHADDQAPDIISIQARLGPRRDHFQLLPSSHFLATGQHLFNMASLGELATSELS